LTGIAGFRLRHRKTTQLAGFIESVIRAPAAARNRADLAFGGGFRDHRRGTTFKAAASIFARILFDFMDYADERRAASWWLRAGLAADESLS